MYENTSEFLIYSRVYFVTVIFISYGFICYSMLSSVLFYQVIQFSANCIMEETIIVLEREHIHQFNRVNS